MDGQLNSQVKRVYKIRPARDSDLEAVVRMGSDFHSSTAMGQLIPFNIPDVVYLFAAALDSGVLLVAVDDTDSAIGLIACTLNPYPYNTAYLCCAEMMFWIDPEHRGGSLATRLLKAAEQEAKAKGADFMVMIALETSPEGIDSYYRKLGYSRTERTYVKGVG